MPYPTAPPDQPVARAAEGVGHRSRVRALIVAAVVAGLAGVGVTLAVAAEPATGALATGPGPAAGSTHAAGPTHAAGHAASGHAAHATKGSHAAPVGRDLAAARRATARFHRLERAEAAGYARLPSGAPLHECIDEDVDLDDTDGTPAMGVHWVNGSLLDGTVSARSPEVLVYEPQADGSLDLVAVEYVVFEAAWSGDRPPTLFGRTFHHFAAPNRYDLPAFYALHAWVWERNPAGLFENFNPRVTCTNAATVP